MQLAFAKAGVEWWKTWINQTSKFVDKAAEGARTIKKDPKSSSRVAKSMTDLGNENVETFSKLYTRMATDLVDGFSRLARSGQTVTLA